MKTYNQIKRQIKRQLEDVKVIECAKVPAEALRDVPFMASLVCKMKNELKPKYPNASKISIGLSMQGTDFIKNLWTLSITFFIPKPINRKASWKKHTGKH